MGRAIVAVIATVFAGFLGIGLGARANAQEFFGILFAIAVMGGFIIYFNEHKD